METDEQLPRMTVGECGICNDVYPVGAMAGIVLLLDPNKPGEEVSGYCCKECWKIILARGAGSNSGFGLCNVRE